MRKPRNPFLNKYVNVEVEALPYGYSVSVLNPGGSERLARYGEVNGWPVDSTVLFQELYEMESFLTPRKLRDLDSGYTVTVRMKPWEALHLWGWDAHTMAEGYDPYDEAGPFEDDDSPQGRFDYLKKSRTPNTDVRFGRHEDAPVWDVGVTLHTGGGGYATMNPDGTVADDGIPSLYNPRDLGWLAGGSGPPTVHPLDRVYDVLAGRRGGRGGGGRERLRGLFGRRDRSGELGDPEDLYGVPGMRRDSNQALKLRTQKRQQQQQQQQQQQSRQKEEQAAKQAARQQEQWAKQQQEEAARKRQEDEKKKQQQAQQSKKKKGKKGMPFDPESGRGGGSPSYEDVFGNKVGRDDPYTIPTGRSRRARGSGPAAPFDLGTDPYTQPTGEDASSGPGRPTPSTAPGGSVAPATNIFKSGPSAVEAAALQAKLEGPSRLSNPEFEEDDEGYNLLGVSHAIAGRICRRFLYANLKYDAFPEGLGESVEELIDSLPEDYAKRLVREGAEEMASYCMDRRASDYHGATQSYGSNHADRARRKIQAGLSDVMAEGWVPPIAFQAYVDPPARNSPPIDIEKLAEQYLVGNDEWEAYERATPGGRRR
jgi:hypothetical protein